MKKNIALGAAALVGVAGGGAPVAATQGPSSPEGERDAIVADVAEELGVAPARVESAFRRALENRVDAAVAAGRLSAEEGAALKERIRSGELPHLGLRGGGRGHGHHHGPGAKLSAAAEYLGVTEAELRAALRDGDSLAEQARERGKSVDGLVGALVAAVTAELDRAVADGELTDAQRDDRVAELERHVSELVQREGPPGRPFGGHRRP